MTYGPPTTGPDAPGEGPDNASTLVLNGKAPAARPAAEPPAEEDPLTGTLPLADVPVVAPPAPPAPERAKPTVTVLPVAAPPVGAPASRLLSAVAAVAADGEVPTACLTRGGGAVTCPQPPAAAAPPQPVPTGARPKLRVTRGQRVNVEYPLFDGPNLIGRRDDKPVDVNLEDQEPADRIWS